MKFLINHGFLSICRRQVIGMCFVRLWKWLKRTINYQVTKTLQPQRSLLSPCGFTKRSAIWNDMIWSLSTNWGWAKASPQTYSFAEWRVPLYKPPSKVFQNLSSFLGSPCCTSLYAWYVAVKTMVRGLRFIWCHGNAHASDAIAAFSPRSSPFAG